MDGGRKRDKREIKERRTVRTYLNITYLSKNKNTRGSARGKRQEWG